MNARKSDGSIVKWRTIASLGTSWMFFIMGITGLILYVVPQGRIAYWVDWRFMGLSKTDWGNIHIVTSILFVLAGGWHIYFNWRAFLGHIRRKLAEGVRLRKELLITTAVAALVVVSALWHVPPLGYLVDLNEYVKASWIESEEYEPPFGHAELLSLGQLCKRTNIDLRRAREELERRGIAVESNEQTVEDIAAENGLSPKDVFAAIRRFQKQPEIPAGRQLTADDVVEIFEGTGLGKKTIAEACAAGDEQLSRCLARLKAVELEAEPHETVREVALRADLKPIRVLQKMLVDPRDPRR
jgi:hypothetical protein